MNSENLKQEKVGKLDVLYEDNHVIVVVKPQNIPSQPDASGDVDMLSLVKEYVKVKYNKAGEAFIGLVHRLDRPTGGIMVFARNSKSASRLSAQLKDGTLEKIYYTVTNKCPKEKKGLLVNYIKKDLRENKASIVPLSEKGAKRAELFYEVLEEKDKFVLLKIKLQTGRGHQIRLQLANIGCTVYGDAKYSGKNKQISTKNLALWAGELKFKHPTQDKVLIFKVAPPDETVFSKFDIDKYL